MNGSSIVNNSFLTTKIYIDKDCQIIEAKAYLFYIFERIIVNSHSKIQMYPNYIEYKLTYFEKYPQMSNTFRGNRSEIQNFSLV